jgi:hypothetical protein
MPSYLENIHLVISSASALSATMRETEWVRRILSRSIDVVLCLCGRIHVEPFTLKMKAKGCDIAHLDLTAQGWFRGLYGIYCIVEKSGERYLESRFSIHSR